MSIPAESENKINKYVANIKDGVWELARGSEGHIAPPFAPCLNQGPKAVVEYMEAEILRLLEAFKKDFAATPGDMSESFAYLLEIAATACVAAQSFKLLHDFNPPSGK